MDKTLVAISILLGSILVIENMAISTQALIFVGYGKGGTLSLISILLGTMLGYGLKGLMTNKKTSEYDDDGGF